MVKPMPARTPRTGELPPTQFFRKPAETGRMASQENMRMPMGFADDQSGMPRLLGLPRLCSQLPERRMPVLARAKRGKDDKGHGPVQDMLQLFRRIDPGWFAERDRKSKQDPADGGVNTGPEHTIPHQDTGDQIKDQMGVTLHLFRMSKIRRSPGRSQCIKGKGLGIKNSAITEDRPGRR